ncbi:hypothetical protein [Deinococcus apachensis]|uniref:hypothetical protein n=1 Tax=Deinococcus apachensis TaxID=309886 RepID=UPI0003650289|nr:hypothetical protein [Deinococcus apachensis]
MPTRSRPARRPNPAHFTLNSRGRVYGVFVSLEDVQECTSRLLDLGLRDQAVQLIMGDEGQQALDVEGHGLWGRFLRLMQGMTDERPHIEQYAHALGRGEIVLSVDLSGAPGSVAQVAQVFRESRAHFVNHYGPWVVESLNA